MTLTLTQTRPITRGKPKAARRKPPAPVGLAELHDMRIVGRADGGAQLTVHWPDGERCQISIDAETMAQRRAAHGTGRGWLIATLAEIGSKEVSGAEDQFAYRFSPPPTSGASWIGSDAVQASKGKPAFWVA